MIKLGQKLIKNLTLLRVYKQSQEIRPRQGESNLLTEAQKKHSSIPIHLRQYDSAKYQVPSSKIKRNSGYAVLQIEPFPRARIMRICYNMLERVKIGIPETSIFRIFTEQRTKHIMNLTDQTEDIEKLQELLGCQSIELYIQVLARQIQLIQAMRQCINQKADEIPQSLLDYKTVIPPKNPLYKRGQRDSKTFID